MKRDKQFYQEEENPQQNESQESAKDLEVNDTLFFSQLVGYMREALLSGTAIPLTNGNKRIVDIPKCMQILDDMDDNLPAAVQYGVHIFREQDRIKGKSESDAINLISSAEHQAQKIKEDAEKEAKQIIADAKYDADKERADAEECARRLLAQDSITRRAEDEAKKLKAEARVSANETRLKANDDAYSLLSDLEGYLSETLHGLQQCMKDFNDNEE